MKIEIREHPGQCRWCGCSDAHGCAMGCAWVNRDHTLCSACAPLDRAVRTIAGRRGLAEVVQDIASLEMPA